MRAGRVMRAGIMTDAGTGAHDLSGGGDVLARITRFAGRAARAGGCGPGTTVRLLNVSENATYLVRDPGEGPSILRVHRLGYHSAAEIESELAWMEALRAGAGARPPRGRPAAGGGRVSTRPDDTGQERHCVRFESLAGTEPAGDDA